MVNQRETTEEKLEKNFATNTLGKTQQLLLFTVVVYIQYYVITGTYILTTELMPALERSKFHPRVVSFTYTHHKFRFQTSAGIITIKTHGGLS